MEQQLLNHFELVLGVCSDQNHSFRLRLNENEIRITAHLNARVRSCTVITTDTSGYKFPDEAQSFQPIGNNFFIGIIMLKRQNSLEFKFLLIPNIGN